MRQFVVLAHEAAIDSDFSLDDLPGAGRMDVLCRCITAAFLLSHGIRTDVRVYLVLQDTVTVRFEGAAIRHLNPDERSTGALLRQALAARTGVVGQVEVESSPGIHVSHRGLGAVLTAIDGDPLIQLHEAGRPVVEREPPTDPVFVLSDHGDPTETEETRLANAGAERVSLGPMPIHANHAITVVHNYLDTNGYTAYPS